MSAATTKAKAPAVKDAGSRTRNLSNRIEEIRERRKGRTSVDVSQYRTKLNVPEHLKDPSWEYRWVNDGAMRIHEMKQRDWEPVGDDELAADDRNVGIGTSVQRVANERTVKAPQNAVLMRKPKEFYREDKAREQGEITDQEQEMLKVKEAEPDDKGLSGPEAYVPGGKNVIKHGR